MIESFKLTGVAQLGNLDDGQAKDDADKNQKHCQNTEISASATAVHFMLDP